MFWDQHTLFPMLGNPEIVRNLVFMLRLPTIGRGKLEVRFEFGKSRFLEGGRDYFFSFYDRNHLEMAIGKHNYVVVREIVPEYPVICRVTISSSHDRPCYMPDLSSQRS